SRERPVTPWALSRSSHQPRESSGTLNTVVPTSPVPGRPRAMCGNGKYVITVIEVIDAWFVEIDGLLHPPQAERAGPEGVVLGCVLRHRRDVVQPLDL